MYSKITGVAFLIVFAQAEPLQDQLQATSFTSFNKLHNTIHHIHSTTVAVPVHSTLVHVAPIQVALVQVAPVHYAPIHVAPVVTKSVSAKAFESVFHGHAPAPVAKLLTPVAPVLIQNSQTVTAHHEEEHGLAKYKFAYGVQDRHTGDIHSHKESRDGDITQGEYSLHDADDTTRTVKYTGDKHSGFNAIVKRSAVHAQPVSHH